MPSMVESEVVVLSASTYQFVDEQSGEIKKGLTVHYVSDLLPKEDANGKKGCAITKANFPVSEFKHIQNVPAKYLIGYDIGADAKGKAKLVYNDLVFSSELVLK